MSFIKLLFYFPKYELPIFYLANEWFLLNVFFGSSSFILEHLEFTKEMQVFY